MFYVSKPIILLINTKFRTTDQKTIVLDWVIKNRVPKIVLNLTQINSTIFFFDKEPSRDDTLSLLYQVK